MITAVILTLLAIPQAVFGHPVNVNDFYDLSKGLSSIVTVAKPTQTVNIHSIDALMHPEGLFEVHSTSSAPDTTTTAAALRDTVGASTTTPAALLIPTKIIMLAVIIPLGALVVALVAYKTIIARRRAASLPAPTPMSPTPLIANIRVVAVTEIPAKFEQDEAMKSVRDFWSPISPGPPELHVEYKNLEVAIGTAVDPATTRLPLLARDVAGFFYDSDNPPATTSTGTTEDTLKSPPSVDRDTSSAAPDTKPVDEVGSHEPISTAPVVDDRGICSRPSTPKSVQTVCTLTSISSSPSLHSLETPTEATRCQRSVLGTVNRVPLIRIIEASPDRAEKVYGCVQRFNSRAITPRQARLQNLI